jgi:hypothetical protein
MSATIDDSIKRWTAKQMTALVVEIIQGKTTVAEASRAVDFHHLRSKAGSMTRSAARRTRCGRTRRIVSRGVV